CLGCGGEPPGTSLGLLVAKAQSAVLTRPRRFYFPGVLLIIIVLAMNYAGEGLRDAVNPKPALENPLTTSGTRHIEVTVDAEPQGLVDVRHLSVDFGEHRAVNDVSFAVDSGQVVALVGESGSGKTLSALS